MKKELQILLKTDLERQLFWDLNCDICRWRQARELPLVRACWQTSSTVYWTKALQKHQGLQKQVRNICEHQKSRVMSLFPSLSYYMLLYSSTQLFSPWFTLNTNLWWNKLNDEILSNLIKYLRNKLYTCTLRYVQKIFITTILLTWCYKQITLWID